MDTVYELITAAQNGDTKARDKLLSDNSGLIWACVKRFYGRGVDKEDLYQLGAIGFLKGIDRFDTGYKVKLSTYIVPMIYGEIRRFLRDDGIIKVSRSTKELGIKIENERKRYITENEAEPDIDYLKEKLGVEREEIVLAMGAGRNIESIYAKAGDDEIYLIDRLAGSNNEDERAVTRMDLMQAVMNLEEKEKKLISMRYMEDKTQVQTALSLGMSQVQVSRLEKKILKKIKQCIV